MDSSLEVRKSDLSVPIHIQFLHSHVHNVLGTLLNVLLNPNRSEETVLEAVIKFFTSEGTVPVDVVNVIAEANRLFQIPLEKNGETQNPLTLVNLENNYSNEPLESDSGQTLQLKCQASAEFNITQNYRTL